MYSSTMAKASTAVAVLLVCSLLASCQAALPPRPFGECLDPSYPTGGFRSGTFQISAPQPIVTPTQTTVTVAKDFTVEYFDTYKLVTNILANETYALYQCGMPPPTGLPANTKMFSIPLISVAADDAAAIAFMKQLGVQDRTTFVSPYAVDPCMMNLGVYGCDRLTNETTLMAGKIDGMFTYADATFGVDPSNKQLIAITAAPDPGVLNRAEWIKYLAVFFNKEDTANQLFTSVSTNYANKKAQVAAAASTNETQRPLLAWTIYFPAYNSPDYSSPASIEISFATYKQEYATDAGGRSLDLATVNTTAQTIGTYGPDFAITYNGNFAIYNFTLLPRILRAVLADVDILVEESMIPGVPNQAITYNTILNLYNLQPSDLQFFKFFKNNKVVRNDAYSNPQGYTNWFEMGLARPDLVLNDLAAVVTPTTSVANAQPLIMRVLGQEPSIALNANTCPLQNCQFSVQTICPLVYKDCSGNLVVATEQQRCAPTCTPSTTVQTQSSASGKTVVSIASVLLAVVLALLL